MLICLEIGRRIGVLHLAKDPAGARAGVPVYLVLDIEYPRFGLIRVDAFDEALVELRESMK